MTGAIITLFAAAVVFWIIVLLDHFGRKHEQSARK